VANEKAKKRIAISAGEGNVRKMHPMPKEKIHPIQLSTLAIAKYF